MSGTQGSAIGCHRCHRVVPHPSLPFMSKWPLRFGPVIGNIFAIMLVRGIQTHLVLIVVLSVLLIIPDSSN